MIEQRWEQPPQTYVTVDGRRRGLWRDSDGFMQLSGEGEPSPDRAWLQTEYVGATWAEAGKAMHAAVVAADKAVADAKGRSHDRSLTWGILLFAAAWVALCIMWVL